MRLDALLAASDWRCRSIARDAWGFVRRAAAHGVTSKEKSLRGPIVEPGVQLAADHHEAGL